MVPHISLLFFCRISEGIAVGFYSVLVPLFISEFMPPSLVSSMGALHLIVINFGMFLPFLLGWIMSQAGFGDFSLVLFIVNLITLVIQSILLIWVFPYETPVYLFLNNRFDEAKYLIRIIYKDTYVEEVYEEKKA